MKSTRTGFQAIPFEKHILSNGLEVILHEDHSIPIVSVNVWYHVGSKNEKPGRTGFAHLFEHMMFEGSEHYDREFFEPLEKIGATINGSTTEDRTNYWENLPANYLELALWLESDRMGYLLPAMTQEKLDNQRDVVKNERRQSYENQPYGKANDVMPQLLYPANHPYSWPVIGSMEDLTSASIDDIADFFRRFYTPNNASLCIAGDFKSAEALKLVEKYFGSLPAGPPVDRLTSWVPSLDRFRRAVIEDNVSLTRLYYCWHTPALYYRGDAEFDLLSNILSSGKTSRLYKNLVYEKQLAQDAQGYQASNELSSTFNIVVTVREGRTAEEVEEAVRIEIEKLLSEGITDQELKQAQTGFEASFVRSLEQVGGFSGRADRLNGYNVMLGDPGRFEWDLNRYLTLTPADVMKEVRKYLDLEHFALLTVVPQEEFKPQEVVIDRTVQPASSPEPVFTAPQIQKAQLDNGLQIFLVEDHRLPLVQANVIFRSGWAADPVEKPGAASLTAELMDEGTTTRTAMQLSEEVKSLGLGLGCQSFFDGSAVRLNSLKKTIASGLDLLSDIVLHPTFPEEELERQRKIYLGRIQQEEKEPFAVGFKTYQRILYGEHHPYAQPYTGSGTEKSILAIQKSDLVNYYSANYFPNNAAVTVAGDLTMQEAIDEFSRIFKDWKPGKLQHPEIPAPTPPHSTRIFLLDKKGAPQSLIVAGHLGIRRNDPDYVAIDVFNNAFGGQFTSRLNMNLREEKGYTYGVNSFFMTTRGIGPYAIYAPVQTQNTREAIEEIIRELRDITQSRPLTPEELKNSRDNLVKGFPQAFQTLGAIAAQLGEIYIYDLPLDEWNAYLKQVQTITLDDVIRVGRERFRPDGMLIVVVGDRTLVEGPIREMQIGDVTVL